MNGVYMTSGLDQRKIEYRTKKMSPIEEKCSCNSGSFLMKKRNGMEKWFCRKCGVQIT